MSDHPTPLGGTCSARFDPLRELFAAKLESGEVLGASLVVNIDGEVVVDVWGGFRRDSRPGRGLAGEFKYVTTAAKISSLGAILYALLTGGPGLAGVELARLLPKPEKARPGVPSVRMVAPQRVES